MSVKYVLVERGKPGVPTSPKKFYATLKSSGEVTLRQLAKEIAARSTVSPADTMAVMESLLQVLPEKLTQGLIVRLGDFGSFYGSITSAGAATAEAFTASSMITSYRIRFRAGKELTRAVALPDYEKTEPAAS